MAELADALDLGSSWATSRGSTPLFRTILDYVEVNMLVELKSSDQILRQMIVTVDKELTIVTDGDELIWDKYEFKDDLLLLYNPALSTFKKVTQQ